MDMRELDELTRSVIDAVQSNAASVDQDDGESMMVAVQDLLMPLLFGTKPEVKLPVLAEQLLRESLIDMERQLRRSIHEAEILSRGDGGFWSKHKGSGSNPERKSDEEQLADRLKYARRLLAARSRIEALDYLRAYFNSCLGSDRWVQ